MKKIILTIIAFALLISTILIDKFVLSKEDVKDISDITVYVEIIKDDEKIEKEIFIEQTSTFLIELNKCFEIEISNGFLYKIDFLEAYNNNVSYIAILINDTYSNKGITNLSLKDQDKVTFVYRLI